MRKNMKKAMCLALSTAMIVALTACGGGDNGGNGGNGSNGGGEKLPEMPAMDTTTPMELHIMTWENETLQTELAKKFTEKYPNITVVHEFVAYGDLASTIQSRYDNSSLPDAFWYVQGVDTPISMGIWGPMNEYWDADAENKNLLKGIEEYKLGYFQTDYKWATPAKVFPSVSWVNQQFFQDNNMNMPSTDWTWEEFETTIKNASMEKAKGQRGSDFRSYGLTNANGCYPVTWYPFACNDNCIGEFGWDGEKYNMTGWATGLNKEAEYLRNGWLLHEDFVYNADFLTATYGETTPATDTGYVAVRNDMWSCWNTFWNTDSFLNNKVYWVPYTPPAAEGATGKNKFANMDMAGISSMTEHPREAYELLKFFQWGVEGWNAKLDIYETTIDPNTEKTLQVSLIDVPITLDEGVWNRFRALPCFPQADDTLNRSEYFDKYFEMVKKTHWVTYGSNQIPGFTTWINNAYHGNIAVEDQVIGAAGVRDGVGIDATELQAKLEEEGLKYYTERHEALLQTIRDFLE